LKIAQLRPPLAASSASAQDRPRARGGQIAAKWLTKSFRSAFFCNAKRLPLRRKALADEGRSPFWRDDARDAELPAPDRTGEAICDSLSDSERAFGQPKVLYRALYM
jgi:hypothetical protein